MRAAYSVAQIRAAEAAAMSLLPEGALMQRAAFALSTRCAEVLRSRHGKVYGSRVVVLCGSGNNGGDALFAVARLARLGASVQIIQLGSSLHTDGLAAARSAGAQVVNGAEEDASWHVYGADLVIDAIVGLGSRPGLAEQASRLARTAAGLIPVIAVDIPSGIDPDTGAVGDGAVKADITVTFGALKPGLLTGPARDLAGVIDVVDIGLQFEQDSPAISDDQLLSAARFVLDLPNPWDRDPDGELPSFPDFGIELGKPLGFVTGEQQAPVIVPELSDIAYWFDPPQANEYKYSRGVVQVIAGSEQFPGAALLASGGARCGTAGMVRVTGAGAPAAVAKYPDLVAAQGRTDAIVVGPGIGLTDAGRAQLEHALLQDVPVVIDADGLTLLARHPELIANRVANFPVTVLTPHAGEAERLGVDPELLAHDRYAAARWLSDRYGAVVVLKGPGTVVTWPGTTTVAVDTAGTSALATAGSGDVLAGLIGSILSIGVISDELAAEIAFAAVFAHGLAGRIASEDGYPVRATDVLDALPTAVAMLRS
jgi:hydroxyethylthiazole kinase-like uncharacterized protein yjeF